MTEDEAFPGVVFSRADVDAIIVALMARAAEFDLRGDQPAVNRMRSLVRLWHYFDSDILVRPLGEHGD